MSAPISFPVMIRRGLVGACAIGAVVLSVLGAASHVVPLMVPLPLRDTDVVTLHFFDGRSRVFWLHSLGDPIRVEGAGAQSIIWVHSQADDSLALPDGVVGPPSPPSFQFPIPIGSRRQVPTLGGAWRSPISPWVRPPRQLAGFPWTVESSFVRVPTWPLVILLMIPPLRNSFFQRRHLRRMSRNECTACGYSLIGLIEPRCPECGSQFSLALMP